jgi:peptidoglycan hydrolase CwlO-like protein
MREEHEEDEDMPPFSQLAAVEYFIEAQDKAIKNALTANRKVRDLRQDLEKRDEEMEDIKTRSAEKDARIEKLMETIKFMSTSDKGDGGDVVAHL